MRRRRVIAIYSIGNVLGIFAHVHGVSNAHAYILALDRHPRSEQGGRRTDQRYL